MEITNTANHSQYELNKYLGLPSKQYGLSKSIILFRETAGCCYPLKHKKCRMIVGFIVSKYKKCLYVLCQKQFYIKVKVTIGKYCKDFVIKNKNFAS